MRLLLIRPGALGDTLLTFPVIEALRAITPHPEVMLVGNRAILPLAQHCGLAEEVADYEESRWSMLFASRLAKQTSPLAQLLRGVDRAIAWLSDVDGLVRQNLLAYGIPQVTVVSGRPPVGERGHVMDYLARTAGVTVEPRPCYARYFAPPASTSPEQQAFAIHPGSGGAQKCWPVERFAAVIQYLWRRGLPVQLLGGPAEHARLEALLSQLPPAPQPGMLQVLLDVPLADLAYMLRQCRGYLGNDSGITHLAALLGVPTLVLFGPSNPRLWQPRGRIVQAVYEPELANLSADMVIERLATFL